MTCVVTAINAVSQSSIQWLHRWQTPFCLDYLYIRIAIQDCNSKISLLLQCEWTPVGRFIRACRLQSAYELTRQWNRFVCRWLVFLCCWGRTDVILLYHNGFMTFASIAINIYVSRKCKVSYSASEKDCSAACWMLLTAHLPDSEFS